MSENCIMADLTDADLERLEALAKAATPGRWEHVKFTTDRQPDKDSSYHHFLRAPGVLIHNGQWAWKLHARLERHGFSITGRYRHD